MSDAKKPDLMSRSLIDLREMLERENKLLANERFLARLKDKGEKIRQFRDEIERAIQIKQSLEETESFLAKLSLGEKAILPKHPMVSRWRVILVAFKKSADCPNSSNSVLFCSSLSSSRRTATTCRRPSKQPAASRRARTW